MHALQNVVPRFDAGGVDRNARLVDRFVQHTEGIMLRSPAIAVGGMGAQPPRAVADFIEHDNLARLGRRAMSRNSISSTLPGLAASTMIGPVTGLGAIARGTGRDEDQLRAERRAMRDQAPLRRPGLGFGCEPDRAQRLSPPAGSASPQATRGPPA